MVPGPRSIIESRAHLLAAAAASAIAVCASPAYAQASAPNPEAQQTPLPLSSDAAGDIVVTAQRRSESLLNVPLAVTAITGDALQRRGISQPTELRSIIPNLQVNDTNGGAEPNFTLRGIGVGTDYSSNQASPVGVYADDAYLAFRTTYNGQMFDLERVEVLRGPQGTLFGRNTTGGAINFVTRKPGLSGSNGYVDLGYGDYNEVRAEAAAEATLIDGVLGVRGAVSYDRRDGYFRNLFPERANPADANNLRARIAVRYRPSEALDINLKLFANHSYQFNPGSQTTGIGPGGVNPITGYSRANLGFYEVESENPHRNSSSSKGGALTVKLRLSDDLSVQSLTSYDTARSLLGGDVDASPVDLLQATFFTRYNEVNQELRFVYNHGAVKAQGGLFYGRDQVDIRDLYKFLGFLEGLGVPADPSLTNGGATIDQNYTQVRTSAAIFGQADIEFLPRLTLTVGARYTKDTAQYENGTAFIGDYNFNPLVQTVGTPGNPLNQRGGSKAVTGRAALNYKFDSGLLLYASYNRGYRAGTFNGQGYLDASQVSFVAPEIVNAYEGGIKGRFFNNALTLAAAGFYYDYSNQQIQDQVGAVAFLRSGGKSTLTGFEVESTARFSPAASLSANLGYTHSRYDQLTLQGIDLSGNELPLTPAVTSTVRFDYTVPDVSGGQLLLSPSVTYTSKEFFTPYNNALDNAPLQQSGFAILDAVVEWKKGPWAVRLWGKNLTETHYYAYEINLTSFGFYYRNPGAPRTFGVAVHRNF